MYSQRLGDPNGKPIIIAHGWGRSGADMLPLARALAPDCDLHIIDLPGFGHSPRPSGTWGSDDYAAAVVQYLDEHNLERVDYVGHSFGGKVGISLAARYPERLQQLVLIASSGLRPRRSVASQLRSRGVRVMGRGAKKLDSLTGSRLFHEWFSPRYGSADYLAAGKIRDILVKAVNEEIITLLPSIQAPTLLLWGGSDTETPVEIGQRMAAQIPNAQLLIFPDKGHQLPFDGGGHLCARYIAPFLDAKRGVVSVD